MIDIIPTSPATYNVAHAEVTEEDSEKGTKLLRLTALRRFGGGSCRLVTPPSTNKDEDVDT